MKKSEYICFVFHNGLKAYCFIKSRNRYFILNPDRIIISAHTQVIKLLKNKPDEIILSNQLDSIKLKPSLLPQEVKEFLEDLENTFKTTNWKYSTSLENKKVTIINLKGYSEKIKPKKAGTISISEISDDLPLKKQERQSIENTQQTIEFAYEKKGECKFREVIEEAISQI